jgi:hypothetical protein
MNSPPTSILFLKVLQTFRPAKSEQSGFGNPEDPDVQTKRDDAKHRPF